ncbi:MAG TPA: hypothetical protein VFJ16_30840 [Longimicrobium sp.]|nr:hypothetical protein [Longimicrobium sp.]
MSTVSAPGVVTLASAHPAGEPLAGLELPPRALAWTDDAGRAWLSYADPATLAARHGLEDALVAPLHALHAPCRAAAGPGDAAG